MTDELLVLTTDIVSAHVSHNNVSNADLPHLIRSTFDALRKLGTEPEPEAPVQEPAVSIRASVKPDYLVCLEDGKKLTMLKRYLRTNFGMSPQEYRAKWNLPADYPMVAPNYAEKRRTLAHSIGLGRKSPAAGKTPVVKAVQAAEPVAEPIVKAVKAGRRKLGIAVETALDVAPAATAKAPATKPKTPARPRGTNGG